MFCSDANLCLLVVSLNSDFFQLEDDKVNEFEVWQGLANLYSSLSHWKDAEICLDKAREMKPFSASILHTEGIEDHIYILCFLIGLLSTFCYIHTAIFLLL